MSRYDEEQDNKTNTNRHQTAGNDAGTFESLRSANKISSAEASANGLNAGQAPEAWSRTSLSPLVSDGNTAYSDGICTPSYPTGSPPYAKASIRSYEGRWPPEDFPDPDIQRLQTAAQLDAIYFGAIWTARSLLTKFGATIKIGSVIYKAGSSLFENGEDNKKESHE